MFYWALKEIPGPDVLCINLPKGSKCSDLQSLDEGKESYPGWPSGAGAEIKWEDKVFVEAGTPRNLTAALTSLVHRRLGKARKGA